MKGSFQLGDKVDQDSGELTRMPPPVVFQVQPDSFVRIESPQALRSWEKAVRATSGVEMRAIDELIESATESCSAGCTDDCDMC